MTLLFPSILLFLIFALTKVRDILSFLYRYNVRLYDIWILNKMQGNVKFQKLSHFTNMHPIIKVKYVVPFQSRTSTLRLCVDALGNTLSVTGVWSMYSINTGRWQSMMPHTEPMRLKGCMSFLFFLFFCLQEAALSVCACEDIVCHCLPKWSNVNSRLVLFLSNESQGSAPCTSWRVAC